LANIGRFPHSISSLPGSAYRRASALRSRSREGNFRARLRVDPNAPELLLSPHCDDAVLDCWSLLTSDRPLVVANLFAGAPPPGGRGVWEALIGVADSRERARERVSEDARALARAGREAVNMPLLDVQFRRQSSDRLDLGELDRALADEVAPSASRVYVPAGIGAHRDHLLARRYGRALLRAGMPVTLYAELPYCTFHGWPSWVNGGNPAPRRNVDAYWQSSLAGVPEMPSLHAAEVIRLDPASARAKGEAVWCYESSLNYSTRYLMSDPAFGGFEVRWTLVRPVAPSDPAHAQSSSQD
jgi:hypothetical protein